MSKAKSNHKNFFHYNNNKADGKKKLWCKEHPSSECRARSFCFSCHTAKDSQSVRPEVPLHRVWVQGGCVSTVKWLETQQWILWFSPLKAIIWLVLGFLETSREIDFSVLTTRGVLFLERCCTVWKVWELLPKAPHGCSEIRRCSPGTAAKHWGFVCFSTQHPSTWVWAPDRCAQSRIYT